MGRVHSKSNEISSHPIASWAVFVVNVNRNDAYNSDFPVYHEQRLGHSMSCPDVLVLLGQKRTWGNSSFHDESLPL